MQKIGYIALILVLFGSAAVFAAAPEDINQLQKNIQEKNSQIDALNKEIEQLNKQIQTVNGQSKTLQNAIKSLDTTKSKLLKEIEVTQNKIAGTNLTIEQLAIEIDDKEKTIERNRVALANAVRAMSRAEDTTFVESLLSYENIALLWGEIESLNRFQAGVEENVAALRSLKLSLDEKKQENEQKKSQLTNLRSELTDQKVIVDNNKKEKNQLLTQTKSQEALYKKQLEEKKRLADEFEKDLEAYEAQLKFLIDPTSYPSPGKGILKWPLSSIHITQYFGNTEFAKSGAYKGSGHNGVDFRASRGTPVKSSLGGVVKATGNTDAVPGCYSYGKWVMVDHNNGISTLYAHLDLIKVSQGQQVTTGEIIGYSGNTGYSTGPHLHFGVYATQGVKIVKYEHSKNCKNAIIPVADLRAYLNPMEYL